MKLFRNRKKKLTDIYEYMSYEDSSRTVTNSNTDVNDGWDKIHCAAYIGNTDLLVDELNAGKNVNAYSEKMTSVGGFEGRWNLRYNKEKIIYWKYVTPLYLAAQMGHKDCVKILMERGADPNIKAYNTNVNESFSISGTASTYNNFKSLYIIKKTKVKTSLLSN